MGVIKGIISKIDPNTKNVTVTEDSNKVGLDVTILNAADVGSSGDTTVNTQSAETDTNNSTSTLLVTAASFTGTWTQRTNSTMIMSGASDQDFTFIAQFSTDGINIDSNLTYTYTAGEINIPKRLIIAREYFRVVVMNTSGSDMTYLRFQTSTGEFPPIASKLNAILPPDADADVVRSIQAGQQPDGDYVNVRADGGAVDVDGVDVFSDTPLGSGANYESGWTDTDGFKSIEISIEADQLSDTGGIIVEYTNDANVVTPVVELTKSFEFNQASVDQGDLTILIPPRLDGFRIRYVNGTSAQSMFLLAVTLRTGVVQSVELPISSTINQSTNANITRSVVSGLTPTGEYKNVTVNAASALNTADFMLGVAQGDFTGYSISTKFGNNADIDILSAPEDIWAGGSTYTGQPDHGDSAETIEVFSDDTSDTAAGTGARTVRITGLDENWEEQMETVSMSGTTAVTTISQWRRVFRVEVVTAGSQGENDGVITVRHSSTTANIFAKVPVERNQSAIASYTVPAGKTMYIIRFRASIVRSNGSAGSAQFTIRTRKEDEVYRAIRNEAVSTSFPVEYGIRGAIILTEKTDIKIRCESVSDNNTQFAAAFEYLLIDNI